MSARPAAGRGRQPHRRWARTGRRPVIDSDLRQLAHRPDRRRARSAPCCTWRSRVLLRSKESRSAGARSSASGRSRTAQHAQKIVEFLVRTTRSISTCPTLEATVHAVRAALAAARRRSSPRRTSLPSSTGWPAVAASAGDHREPQFLQWFIEEQVEEEAPLQSIVDLLDCRIDLFQADALLDRFERDGARACSAVRALTAGRSVGTLRTRMSPTFYFRCPA